MTDPPDDPGPDVDPDLELASALHDGAVTAAERARAVDPAVRAARSRIERVAARVADVPSPPPGLLDAHVAVALAALDAEAVSGAGARSVEALADRRRWSQRAPLGAVAAAVAVVALLGAISLASGGRGTDEDHATAALEAVEDGADGGASPAAGASGDTALPASARETFATYDDMGSALAERVGAASDRSAEDSADAAPMTEAEAAPERGAGSAAPAPSTATGCDPIAIAGLDPSSVELVSSVIVDGRPIVAIVHDHAGTPTVTSIDEGSCTVADRRPLPRS